MRASFTPSRPLPNKGRYWEGISLLLVYEERYNRSGGVHPRLIVYYASPPGRGQAPTLQCDTILMRRICGRGQAPTLQCETIPMRRICGRGQAPTLRCEPVVVAGFTAQRLFDLTAWLC